MTVSMDAQGPEKILPYVDIENSSYQILIDQENKLGPLLGFRAIPNGFLIDEIGIVKYKQLGNFDVRKPETLAILQQWIDGTKLSYTPSKPSPEVPIGDATETNALFVKGLSIYKSGDVDTAMSLWRKSLSLDPTNYIIRKQIWAIENPERFYNGDIDYDWQSKQAT